MGKTSVYQPNLRSRAGATHLAAVLSGALGVAACGGGHDTCGLRGTPQTYTGSEQYVGTLDLGDAGAGAGVFGSTLRTASVDWDPYLWRSDDGVTCSGTGRGPGEKLTVTLGACALSGTVTSTSWDTGRGSSGAFISAAASLDPGQSCAIPVSGGTATVKLDSGAITWDGPTTMRVFFAGAITDWTGSAPQGGVVTYTFQGTSP